MQYIAIISAFLIVLSKFFDCWTTLKGIDRIGIGGEKNALARRLMYKYGYKKVIWGIFAITILIVFIVYFYVERFYGIFGQITFIVFAIFISFLHFAVALNNIGKKTIISRQLEKFVYFMNKYFR